MNEPGIPETEHWQAKIEPCIHSALPGRCLVQSCSHSGVSLMYEIGRLQHRIECADTPLMRDVLRERDELRAECERLRAALDEAMPLIAALAIYGENANLAALAAKARELNEAHQAALGEADDE